MPIINNMLSLHKSRCLHHMLICLLIFATSQLDDASATTQDLLPIPLPCDGIVCPPEAEMQCPEDSSVLEKFIAVDLIKLSAETAAPIAAQEKTAYNSSIVDEEMYAQCCLTKKCTCKTCYIQDCDTEHGEVTVELQPEAMDTPGLCCGKYECRREPNCTEAVNTDFYWLQHCQRCHCMSGALICHQSCDVNAEDENPNAICQSKNLNNFYKDGESWKDGCYECECVAGQQKCVIPFCGNVDCPSERQVMLKDSCCPICWPKGEPMPNGYGNGYDDYNIKDIKDVIATEQTLLDNKVNSTAGSADSSVSTELNVQNTTTAAPLLPIIDSSTHAVTALMPPPCPTSNADIAPDARDYPAVVEVVHTVDNTELKYHIIIAILVIIIIVLLLFIKHLRDKQRSYRPVSNIDDKV